MVRIGSDDCRLTDEHDLGATVFRVASAAAKLGKGKGTCKKGEAVPAAECLAVVARHAAAAGIGPRTVRLTVLAAKAAARALGRHSPSGSRVGRRRKERMLRPGASDPMPPCFPDR